MPHPDHIKAQALALLVLGNTPRYVAKQLGIPRMTVWRWQIEARRWARMPTGEAWGSARRHRSTPGGLTLSNLF
jgi:hypothetical protein